MAQGNIEVIVTPISYAINHYDSLKTAVNYESPSELKNVVLMVLGKDEYKERKIHGEIVGNTMVFDTDDFANGVYLAVAEGKTWDNQFYKSNEFTIWHFA